MWLVRGGQELMMMRFNLSWTLRSGRQKGQRARKSDRCSARALSIPSFLFPSLAERERKRRLPQRACLMSCNTASIGFQDSRIAFVFGVDVILSMYP
jgi:hypothetical protein